MPSPARILPFPTPKDLASRPPRRPPAGVVATMSIAATEVARLVARDLAGEWVAALTEEYRRDAGTARGRPPEATAPASPPPPRALSPRRPASDASHPRRPLRPTAARRVRPATACRHGST